MISKLLDWAEAHNLDYKIVEEWAEEGLLEGTRMQLSGTWIILTETKVPETALLLGRSERLFRKKFFEVIAIYEEALKEGDINPPRARWTKQEVMSIARWPYPKQWRTLREVLESRVGLIMLLPGSRASRDGVIRPWTFATCAEDREQCIVHATRCQIGGMKRTARVVSQALAPPDEKHALEDESKDRINEALKAQEVKLDAILDTLQTVKEDLLERETMDLLERYNQND